MSESMKYNCNACGKYISAGDGHTCYSPNTSTCQLCINKDAEIERLQARLRDEIISGYDDLAPTRKARYKGAEEYADAVLKAEARGEDDA